MTLARIVHGAEAGVRDNGRSQQRAFATTGVPDSGRRPRMRVREKATAMKQAGEGKAIEARWRQATDD
jgi:hypothetical protein